MIMITNGADVLTVTNGAYQAQYKPFGWYPVADKGVISTPKSKAARARKAEEIAAEKAEKEEIAQIENEVSAVNEMLNAAEEVEPEKPLSEMSDNELKEKAKQYNIDYKQFQSRKALRRAISEAMRG